MRLDDVNALVDALRIADRERRRLLGGDVMPTTTVSVPTVSQFREIATITDTSIRRSEFNGATFMTLTYRGYEFNCLSGEVA